MNKKIIVVLVVSFLIRLWSLMVSHDLWWDSSVYIGMGKYIWSLGSAGLWEANRPLVWPFLLGLGWILGLDVVLFGRIIVMLAGLGSIYLIYLIAKKIFDERIALFSALLFSFSATFIRFNNILFTGIVSGLFLLLGIYYFFEKKHFVSGLWLGIAFMMRFFHVFFAIVIGLFYLYEFYKKKVDFRDMFRFGLGCLIFVVPFLVLNLILYGNMIYPFVLQAWMTRNTGWIFHEVFSFYFVNLIFENFLAVFSILGLYVIIKNKKKNQLYILFLFLVPFILYLTERHKEMRLLIGVLPLLSVLVAQGIIYFSSFFKKYGKLVVYILVVLFLFQAVNVVEFDRYDDNLGVFYNYMDDTQVNDGIWISNPSMIVHSDKKTDMLIYFPLYYSKKIKELVDNVDDAKLVMFNSCDVFPCPEDDSCIIDSNDFLDKLNKTLVLKEYRQEGICKHYIFEA